MLQGSERRRIFVVDDEDILAMTVALILQREGFDATSFTRPLDALQAADADAPDLLISDILMPSLSGIELATQVKQRCPNCKILLFSGQAGSSEMIQEALGNGHRFELINKPVHPADLLKKIQEIIQVA